MVRVREALHECINDVHRLAHDKEFVNNRDARAKMASEVVQRLTWVLRSIDKIEHALENIEHHM